MQQYKELLESIILGGVAKPSARENMPGTASLFGYQFRHNMADGFPLLTTKEMYWKGVVAELLWFLRGDTNIKYLVDNKVNIWNEDAYNYYLKVCEAQEIYKTVSYELFCSYVKNAKSVKELSGDSMRNSEKAYPMVPRDYTLGDCGFQYGKVWRRWPIGELPGGAKTYRDQIKKVLDSLKNNPISRRHIVTAIDPAHDEDLALYWCHALAQFNCRPIEFIDRAIMYEKSRGRTLSPNGQDWDEYLTARDIPEYYLDLQLYQRSADVFLGVPFNIASYALLLQIMAEVCNMVPGEFIHTFGDVHIYNNHKEQVLEQLKREPLPLPKVTINRYVIDKWKKANNIIVDDTVSYRDFELGDYQYHPPIKGELSTGLKK